METEEFSVLFIVVFAIEVIDGLNLQYLAL